MHPDKKCPDTSMQMCCQGETCMLYVPELKACGKNVVLASQILKATYQSAIDMFSNEPEEIVKNV